MKTRGHATCGRVSVRRDTRTRVPVTRADGLPCQQPHKPQGVGAGGGSTCSRNAPGAGSSRPVGPCPLTAAAAVSRERGGHLCSPQGTFPPRTRCHGQHVPAPPCLAVLGTPDPVSPVPDAQRPLPPQPPFRPWKQGPWRPFLFVCVSPGPSVHRLCPFGEVSTGFCESHCDFKLSGSAYALVFLGACWQYRSDCCFALSFPQQNKAS